MRVFLSLFIVLSIVYNTIGQDEPQLQAPVGAPLRPPVNPPDYGQFKTCGYNNLDNLLQNEGKKIGNKNGYNIGLEECKTKCTETSECKSFTWCSIGFTRCHMKGKIVNVDRYEPTKNDPHCKTYYPKVCTGPNPGPRKCKTFGQKCGVGSSTGRNYGECCYDRGLSCLKNPKIAYGAENTCRRCKDNEKWTDHRYGDANNLSRCVDLTLDYCNNVEKYKEAYTTEARKHCPKACGLC